MKKLFLFAVLGVAGLMNANGYVEPINTLETKQEIVLLTDEDEKQEKDGCIHVTLSCGVEYDMCNFTGTIKQLHNSVLSSNNDVCGSDFEMIK